MKLKEKYRIAKSNNIGELTVCPSCGELFVKVTKAQAFCKTKRGTRCKDFYWNNVTPTKRNNTTRISPANARYYEEFIEPRKRANYDDDMGWDAHKDSF